MSISSSYLEKDVALIRIAYCWWNNQKNSSSSSCRCPSNCYYGVSTSHVGYSTYCSHFVNTSKVCFCPVTDRERRPPRRSMSLPDSDLSIAVLFAESESLLSMGIFLHSDLNQNVFHALWGIPTCTGHFRCSKPFCILLYMLNRHKFQPGAKLLVNHLVDQSLGLGVKFSPTSSAHYAKLLRDLWTLCFSDCYQLLVCYIPESSHTPAPGQV